MKRNHVVIVVLLLWAVSLLGAGDAAEAEMKAVKKVILDAYRDGICNVGDVAAIERGFHQEFNLLMLQGDKVGKLPIAKWKEHVAKNKAAGKYPPKDLVEFKFLFVDVIGSAAAAKIEFYRGKTLAYTDFLLLYKFPDGWKLVSKIYHKHE